jgi:hypothetical protein
MDRHPAPVNYGNSVNDGEIVGFPDYQLRGKSHGTVRSSAAVAWEREYSPTPLPNR